MTENMDDEEFLTEKRDNIKLLLDKYKSHCYMFQRLQHHLSSLENVLENEKRNYEKRVERINYLSQEQKIFVQVFLGKNRYYYLQNNNCYYYYNGKHYISVKEDDIQCKLLSEINKNKTLYQWKYKTNNHILKQIKERHLFKSVPESDTIQYVIKSLCPLLFKSKQEVKYFLTILGDNLLKKHPNLFFLTKHNSKNIFAELDNVAYITTGYTNLTSNFFTKYHDTYDYSCCRLLNINDVSSIEQQLKDIIKKNGLDILCVAAHYSMRNIDSDTFIETNGDEDLKNYVFYLKNNDKMQIVEQFCDYSLMEMVNLEEEPNDETEKKAPKNKHFTMTWKNMHFIWKYYISQMSFPNMIYSQQLKTILQEKYKYDEKMDCFLDVTSKYLPIVADFIMFWERNMMTTIDEFTEFDYELENDEICKLFKLWVQKNKEECSSSGIINENDIIKILSHFYPNVDIVERKYIMNISCSLWDKVNDISISLDEFKKQYVFEPTEEVTLIDFDKLYNYYCHFNVKDKYFKVSKRFFEKYICYSLSDYIEYDSFLSTMWISS